MKNRPARRAGVWFSGAILFAAALAAFGSTLLLRPTLFDHLDFLDTSGLANDGRYAVFLAIAIAIFALVVRGMTNGAGKLQRARIETQSPLENAPAPASSTAGNYESFSREERIAFWTQQLWRWGREVTGPTEDALFESRLVEHMRSTDAAIEELLPDILRRLADMLHRDPGELIAEFNRRTGLNIS